jgi:hypothetical protein
LADQQLTAPQVGAVGLVIHPQRDPVAKVAGTLRFQRIRKSHSQSQNREGADRDRIAPCPSRSALPLHLGLPMLVLD